MYDFIYKQLNIKKIIIVCVITIFLIVIFIFLFANSSKKQAIKKQTKTQDISPNSIFFDRNNLISIEVSKTYGLKQFIPENNYIMELRSDDNICIFISETEIENNRSLESIIKADKQIFVENFTSNSNLSDIRELLVNDNLGYTYSFHYLDQNMNKPFYIQIAWLKYNNKYYVFDIEFPLEDMTLNSNIVTEILASFKIENTY